MQSLTQIYEGIKSYELISPHVGVLLSFPSAGTGTSIFGNNEHVKTESFAVFVPVTK